MVGFGHQSIFSFFLASAAVAIALASLVASDMYEAAKVSTQVKSQTRYWPDFHGAMEQPSGRLPSDLHRPMGSSVDGTFIVRVSIALQHGNAASVLGITSTCSV